jgi:hypothetical protein
MSSSGSRKAIFAALLRDPAMAVTEFAAAELTLAVEGAHPEIARLLMRPRRLRLPTGAAPLAV